MSSEELLKRFEFDVMTGRLKSINDSINKIICPFERTDSNELLFISGIFSSLGFKKDSTWNWDHYPTFKESDGIQ